jgi:ERF superfamily protein
MNAVVKQEFQPATVAQQSDATLLAVISRAAADPNTDVEKMERLMAMYERIEAKRAETAFNDSMTECQKAMRPIAADAENPQTRSKYATYGKLDRALRPVYTGHGFGLSFDTGDGAPPDYVRVLCYVSHNGGHSRTHHIDMPADGKGAKGGDVMTKTHAVGSGMSYGMRYLLKMIFNVAVGEDDDDGNGAGGSCPALVALLAEIAAAADVPLLQKVKPKIKAAGLPADQTGRAVATYNDRLRALKEAGK